MSRLQSTHANGSMTVTITAIYPQVGLLYGIKSKAAISLLFNLHCKAIALVDSSNTDLNPIDI